MIDSLCFCKLCLCLLCICVSSSMQRAGCIEQRLIEPEQEEKICNTHILANINLKNGNGFQGVLLNAHGGEIYTFQHCVSPTRYQCSMNTTHNRPNPLQTVVCRAAGKMSKLLTVGPSRI